MAGEDAAVEPHVDWRAWFERAHGTLAWLLENVQPEIYDLLEIPLRWELGDSAARDPAPGFRAGRFSITMAVPQTQRRFS